MNHLIQQIQERMLQPLPGNEAQLKMAPRTRANQLQAPPNARPSAVMILLFMEQAQWHTLLIQRTNDGNVHSGQISFPGGKKEENDFDLVETALRECEEETGIDRNVIEVLGTLSSLYIPPSNFHVTPVLGFISKAFEMNISVFEVQEVIKVSLQELFDDRIKETRMIMTALNGQLESPAYILNDKMIWGATAMMISELEHFIKDLI